MKSSITVRVRVAWWAYPVIILAALVNAMLGAAVRVEEVRS